MVLRGFGNTPVPAEMFIPPGTVPPITDVTYAGTYPLRHYITNPPITTPEFPSNPPRATNKAPVRPFAPYDRLTNTRATTAQLGSLRGHEGSHLGALPAGAYSGAVGRVVRALDADTGAGLRGQIVGARIHGHAAPPSYLHGAHGAHMHGMLGGMLGRGLGAGDVPSLPSSQIDSPVFRAITETYTLTNVKNFMVLTNKDRVNCTLNSSRNELKIKALPVAEEKDAIAIISYTTTAGVERQLPFTVMKADAARVGQAIADTAAAANKILREANRPPIPQIDYQDADVLRACYMQIYDPLINLHRQLVCGSGCENQTKILIDILKTAVQNPAAKTLRNVLDIYCAGRNNTVERVLGPYVDEPAGWAFRAATQAAVDSQTAFIAAQISAQVANAVIGAILGAVTMGAGAVISLTLGGAAITAAAQAFNNRDFKQHVRGFAGAIKAAVLDPDLKPSHIEATGIAMGKLEQAAAVIVAQASAGFRGTPAQEETFRTLWADAQRLGATTQQPQITGIERRPAFETLMVQIKTLRPDLVGIGGGDSVMRDPTDPKWIAARNLQRVAGTTFLGRALSVSLDMKAGRPIKPATAAQLQPLRDAWAKFTAQWPSGITSTLNEAVEITKIRAALVALQRIDPASLTTAGIPAQTLPPGGGEYLPPPGPGDTVSPPPIAPLTVTTVTGTAANEPLDAGSKAGPGTPGGDAGGGAPGPGTGLDRREGGGGEQKSGGIPGWAIAAGAVAIIGGGYLLLRK
jgi:hypothetical protein